MHSKLIIPNKIKVGFQNRQGTYTGKIGYVIYYDALGKLRKEPSWQSWRDKKIEPIEHANEPLSGFVLNKGVGGGRGWDGRNEYVRVYDPRDFEFEISIANLLFILRECDCNKGKGLEGKFVYAWSGTELVLLPECSLDYQESQKFTELQTKKVSAKEMILGATYVDKDTRELTYLGRFEYHYICKGSSSRQKKFADKNMIKRHVFWNGKGYTYLDGFTTIKAIKTEDIHPDYAELVEQYNKSPWGSKIVSSEFLPPKNDKDEFYEKVGDYYRGWYFCTSYDSVLKQYVPIDKWKYDWRKHRWFKNMNGVWQSESDYSNDGREFFISQESKDIAQKEYDERCHSYNPQYKYGSSKLKEEVRTPPKKMSLYVTLESGEQYPINKIPTE